MARPRLQVRRIAYALGAEVSGIDLREPLDDATVAEIRRAWLEHLVLRFPGQKLEKAELLAFARRFGELELVGQPDPETPYITLVTERPVNGRPWQGYKGGQVWHSDKDFTTQPTAFTFLSCREIPEVGGDTMWSNQYMAYEALSPAMRAIVDRLEAVHDYELRLRTETAPSDERTPEQIRRAAETLVASRHGGGKPPPAVHPVARVHPETGRKALYLGQRVRQLAGLTEEESAAFLSVLKEHTVRYEFCYRHHWTLDDLVMWDNRCTLHIALCDYELQKDPRFMYRCAVVGTESGYREQVAAAV